MAVTKHTYERVTYSFGATCHSFESLIYTSNHLIA